VPIIVRHEPDPNLLMQAGYQIGAGQRLQWQQEAMMRQQAQERALQSNFLSQQLAHINRLEEQGNSLQAAALRQQMGFANDQQMLQKRHELDQALQKIEQQDRMEMMKAEWAMRQENERLGNTEGQNRDMAKFYWDQVDSTVMGFKSAMESGYQPPKQQLEAWQRLQQDLAAISADPNHDPYAKAQMSYVAAKTFTPTLGQFAPSPEEAAKSAVQKVQVDGRTAAVYNDGQGNWKPFPKSSFTEEQPAEFSSDRQVISKLTADQLIDAAVKIVTARAKDDPKQISGKKIREALKELLEEDSKAVKAEIEVPD